MFGGIPAVRTHFWGATTLVCVLPPAPTPGQVPVTFKEHPEMASPDRENVMFTYKDGRWIEPSAISGRAKAISTS